MLFPESPQEPGGRAELASPASQSEHALRGGNWWRQEARDRPGRVQKCEQKESKQAGLPGFQRGIASEPATGQCSEPVACHSHPPCKPGQWSWLGARQPRSDPEPRQPPVCAGGKQFSANSKSNNQLKSGPGASWSWPRQRAAGDLPPATATEPVSAWRGPGTSCAIRPSELAALGPDEDPDSPCG